MSNTIPQDTPQKQCTACKQFLPATTEYFHTHHGDQLRPICKTCRQKARRKPSAIVQMSLFTKVCTACNTEKPIEQFCADESRRDGRAYICKNCNKSIRQPYRDAHKDATRTRSKIHYTNNKQMYKERHKTHYVENKQMYREKDRRRQALEKGAKIGEVSFSRILERDGFICHICNKPVEPHDVHLDHVVPLSRGGAHSEDNIKVAHSTCNLRKGNRLMSELIS